MSFFIDSDDVNYRNNNYMHDLKTNGVSVAYTPSKVKKDKAVVSRITKENFISEHSKKFPGFIYEHIGPIFIRTQPIFLICPTCEGVSGLARNFLNSISGCPRCDRQNTPEYKQKQTDKLLKQEATLLEFIRAHKARYPDKFTYADTKCESEYTVTCNIHGNIKVNRCSVNNKRGSGCLQCDHNFTMSRYLEVHDLKLLPTITILDAIKLLKEETEYEKECNEEHIFHIVLLRHFFRNNPQILE